MTVINHVRTDTGVLYKNSYRLQKVCSDLGMFNKIYDDIFDEVDTEYTDGHTLLILRKLVRESGSWLNELNISKVSQAN